MHLGNAIFRVLHERKNTTASSAEKLTVREKMTFAHSLWVNSGKSIEKQQELGHFAFWNCYIQGTPRTEQYTAPYAEDLKSQEKNELYIFTLGKTFGWNVEKQNK